MVRTFAIAAAVLATSPVLAHGAPVDQPPVERVSYADLNLANPVAQATLHARVRRAIGNVCQDMGSSIRNTLTANRCRKQAAIDTQRQMAIVVAQAPAKARASATTLVAAR